MGDLMFKTFYLITFLSVVLFKSESSFGQELKKELGVCGKTMDGILEISPKKNPVLSNASIKKEEFCDNGRYELNANYVIYLYNAKDQLIYDKHVFLNPIVYHEELDKKSKAFKKVEFQKGSNSRIIKFPITNEMGAVSAYKIKSLSTLETSPLQKIQW
jgi:hypothetical protein